MYLLEQTEIAGFLGQKQGSISDTIWVNQIQRAGVCLVTSDPVPSSEPLLRLQIQLKGASGGLMLLSSQPTLLRVTLLKSIICPSLTFLALSLTGLQIFYSHQTKPLFFCFCFLIHHLQLWRLVLSGPCPSRMPFWLTYVLYLTLHLLKIQLNSAFSLKPFLNKVFKLGIMLAGLHCALTMCCWSLTGGIIWIILSALHKTHSRQVLFSP